MKLFNTSKMVSEESIQALINAEADLIKLEAATSMIKQKFLEAYHFKAYQIPQDFAKCSYIIAANHLTDSDAPLIVGIHDQIMSQEAIPYEKMLVFAKENCFNGVSIPKELNPVLEHENVVEVDRTAVGGSIAALKKAIKWYKQNNLPKHYLIFAQGTIYDINKDAVEDIEKGTFWLAKQLGIQVLPAFIEQAVEGEENRMVFGKPFLVEKNDNDFIDYKKLWVERVLEAQDLLQQLTGKPARQVALDPDHQVRKRINY